MGRKETAALLRDAAFAIRDAGGDEGVVGRLRTALADVAPAMARGFGADFLLRTWRSRLEGEARRVEVDVAALRRCVDRYADDVESGPVLAAMAWRERLSAAEAVSDRVARLLSLPMGGLRGELLPVGTTVVTRSDTFRPGATPQPVAGTPAVVVSYAPVLDRPLLVAPCGTVADDQGGRIRFDEGRLATFAVSLADVDVTGPALLVGGGRNEALGFVPTHEGDDGRLAMLVEAAGRVWCPWDGRGLPELGYALLDEESYDWLARIGVGTTLRP